MPKVAGLVRQGSRYSYRRGVPEKLRAIVGKREVWVTLDTSDYAVAVRRAREAAVETDRLLEQAAQALTHGRPPPTKTEASPDEPRLQRIAIRELWAKERVASRALPVPADYERREWDRELHEELAAFETNEPGALSSLAVRARSLLEDDGAKVAAPIAGKTLPPAVSRLISLLRRVEIETLKRQLDRLDGGHGDTAHDPLFATVSSLSPPPPAGGKLKPVSLSEAIKRFETDPTRAHLGDTADAKFVVTFRALREVVGDDRALAEIDREECARVQELIAGLPANVAKLKAYAKLKTLRSTIELAATRGDRLVAPGTVRVYSHTLSAFFNWGIRKGLITFNPATRLAPAKGAAEVTRRPFTVEELNRIVAALPAWSGNRQRAGRFWVPLIAIFSGMRLGEVVTLATADIATVDGINAFVLRRTVERSLKTAGSERVVPVHPDLVRLGLLHHVGQMREASEQMLFPELPGDDQAKRVDLFQKAFSRLQKRTLEIDGPGVSFHSFRHGFRDALREAGVPIDSTRALGGWARSGGVEERYGQGTRPATLARWMDQVRFEGLDLSPIRVTGWNSARNVAGEPGR